MDVARIFDLSQKVEAEDIPETLGGRRGEAVQRLQIGVAGVVLMILMVGLASVIQNRAAESDADAVPEAAPTTEPTEATVKSNPLAEAGVVPDLSAEPATPPAKIEPPVSGAAADSGTNGGE